MDVAAEIGRNPASKRQILILSVENAQTDAGQDGQTCLARPYSQARTETGNIHSLCSAGHDEQNWQPYPVDPYSDYPTYCT